MSAHISAFIARLRARLAGLPLWAAPEAMPWVPILFFAVLLFTRLSRPPNLYFDEIHYIPAAKALVTFQDNINWVHPPFGKYIMGLGWLLFTKATNLIGDPAVFRFMGSLFGLWTLWAVRAWMKRLGFSELAAQAGMWLTGFNFLWYVQSKIGMLDIFYIPLALWGLLWVYPSYAQPPLPTTPGDDQAAQAAPSKKNKKHRHDLAPVLPRKKDKYFWLGWLFLGIAMSTKWATAPYFLIALVFGRRTFFDRCIGSVFSGIVYAFTYLPLAFLYKGPVPFTITGLIEYHKRMLAGFSSIASAAHPYASKLWEWPLLLRPIWYAFESDASGDHAILAMGNPLLYWVAVPFLFIVAWYAVRPRRYGPEDKAAQGLMLLYWIPFLFWAIAPRKLQLYYYYLPPSLWVGPIMVWAHERIYLKFRDPEKSKGRLLFAFGLACAVMFFYFLPIMDARALPHGRFYTYMWLRSWI